MSMITFAKSKVFHKNLSKGPDFTFCIEIHASCKVSLFGNRDFLIVESEILREENFQRIAALQE